MMKFVTKHMTIVVKRKTLQKPAYSIIMVISTIFCDETPDSSVAFYSTDWKPLPTHDYYTLPPIDNFRRVTIDKNTGQLIVSTTNAPLMLNIDGSNQPKEPYTLTNTFHWSTEENRFILDN